ncbi:hypothetical protein OA527_03705 [Pelagibacteraceae bacterium]|nr:hypothetical protein [Pelagibacteraceae bacterium]
MKNKIHIIFIVLILNVISISFAKEQSYKIIKLVNNQVITNYDLEMRLQLFSFLNKVSIDEKSISGYAKQMLNLMIDEKIQLEHINKYQINIEINKVDEYIAEAILKPNQSISELERDLKTNNIDIKILKESIMIQLGWNELSGKLFFRTAEITDIDLSNTMEKNASLSEDQARNLIIQRQIELRAKKLLRDLRSEANIENR